MNALTKYIPNAVTQRVGRQILTISKNSPTILFAGGVVGVVATTVMASRATLHLEETLEETQKNLEIAKSLRNDPKHADEYSDKDYQHDLTVLYTRAVVDVVKLYGPAFLVGAASIAMLTKSHNILMKRNTSLIAAYATLDRAFTEYRKRVIDDQGPDKDLEYRYPSEKAIVEKIDDKGKAKNAEVVRVAGREVSGYARFFDQLCPDWQTQAEYNLYFLRCRQNYLNDMLRARGHVFLNEVYDSIGIARTKEGAVVGWVLNSDGDNYIDFGLYDGTNPGARDFVNGREGAILLDFNVDGIIYDKI